MRTPRRGKGLLKAAARRDFHRLIFTDFKPTAKENALSAARFDRYWNAGNRPRRISLRFLNILAAKLQRGGMEYV